MSETPRWLRVVARTINATAYLSPKLAGAAAFRLFATPPPVRLRPKDEEFLATARTERVAIGALTVPVYSWGDPDAPIVFCSYGWGYNAGRWRHFCPGLLAAGFRVVAFDPPGHGQSPHRGQLDFPTLAGIQAGLIEYLGGVDSVLGHSFGGSCLVDALAELPTELRPTRICLMAIVSEVGWLFLGYRAFMGLNDRTYRAMLAELTNRTGKELAELDVAVRGTELASLQILLVHDPGDAVTPYRNALRNYSHWGGSYLYSPAGAGHHLGTETVTEAVVAWLRSATVPAGASRNIGDLTPLPVRYGRQEESGRSVGDFYR